MDKNDEDKEIEDLEIEDLNIEDLDIEDMEEYPEIEPCYEEEIRPHQRVCNPYYYQHCSP